MTNPAYIFHTCSILFFLQNTSYQRQLPRGKMRGDQEEMATPASFLGKNRRMRTY